MRKLLSMIPLCLMVVLIFALPVQGQTYTDTVGHWAEQDVLKMSALGIINGDGTGHFYPENLISRQEVIALLIRMTGGEPDEVLSLSNYVEKSQGVSDWAASYINSALRQEIITTDELQYLNWGFPAERREVAMWLSKSLKLVPVANDNEEILTQFKDVNNINSKIAPYIIPLVKNEIFIGSNGYFKPYNPIKRGEVATILSRANEKFAVKNSINSKLGQIVNLNSKPKESITFQSLLEKQETVFLTKETSLYRNGEKVGLKDLAPGEWLDYVIDSTNNLIYANVIENGLSSNESEEFQSIIGTILNIDWQSGNLDLESNGNKLKYRLSAALRSDPKIFDEKLITGDEVELSSCNNWIRSLKKYNPYGEYIIYKGTLYSTDTQQDIVNLKSDTVSYLDNYQWLNISNSLSLKVTDSTDIYYDGDKIEFNNLELYEDYSLYLIYNKAQNSVVKIRINQGNETTFDGAIYEVDTRLRTFKLDTNKQIIVYNNSTTVLKDGKIIDNSNLKEDAKLFLLIDRANSTDKAAIIFLE